MPALFAPPVPGAVAGLAPGAPLLQAFPAAYGGYNPYAAAPAALMMAPPPAPATYGALLDYRAAALPAFAGGGAAGGTGSAADDVLWADVYAATCKGGEYAYDTRLVAQLLRFVRNSSASHGHYGEFPAALRARVEARPGGLSQLVLDRFGPGLVLAAWRTQQELNS